MNNFISTIKDLIELFQRLAIIEENKIEASSKNRISFIEECIKEEQAGVLQLRGLDKKREDAQKNMGYANYSFKDILNQVSKEEQEILQPLFIELEQLVSRFKYASKSAQQIIELNLNQINSLISEQEGGVSYDKSRTIKTGSINFTSKKI